MTSRFLEGKLRNEIDELIKITEIAPKTPYSAEYLSLRARQGKIKAQKIGNTWYTTHDYINEYRATQRIRQIKEISELQNLKTIAGLADKNFSSQSKDPSLQTEDVDRRPLMPARQSWLFKWVVIPASLLILVGFIPIEALHQSVVLSMAVVNDLSDDSSPRVKSELQKTVGEPPKTPKLLNDFAVYSKTVFLGLSDRVGQSLGSFYQKHPLLLAASMSNFPEVKAKIANQYGPTSPSSFSLLATSVRRIMPTRSDESSTGQIAGVTSERSQAKGDDRANVEARLIEILGDKGFFKINKGEVMVRLVSSHPITNFSIMPSRLLTVHQPTLRLINQSVIELQLADPAEDDMEVLWQK